MAASGMIQDFKAQLMADKKKSAALGILACVLLAVVGRALLPAGSEPPLVPSGAVASPPPISAPDRITPRPESLVAAPFPAAPRSPSGPVDETSRRTVSIENLPRELARDVFNPSSWSLFPTVAVARDRHATSQPADAFWENLMRAMSEYRSLRREEAAALATDLAELRLQSTLTGPLPLAYVSGRLVHESEILSGFEVIRIEERRVVLERSGRTYELTMR